MECAKTGNRFVCPNDRQLALRAKLQTGWSVKTGSLGNRATPAAAPLEPDERDAIIAVIKRAEKVELGEQQRVGHLIQRLETMRRKMLGRNPSQCLLCAESFGLLKTHRLVCADCKRPVCAKCAIDTCGSKTCWCLNNSRLFEIMKFVTSLTVLIRVILFTFFLPLQKYHTINLAMPKLVKFFVPKKIKKFSTD